MEHKVQKILTDKNRLRNYLLGIFPNLISNSAVKKALKANAIFVNGKSETSGYLVQISDVISYNPQPKLGKKLPPLDIPLVYEDEHLAILDKPAGLLSSGNQGRCLSGYLVTALKHSDGDDALLEPLLVHRLDKATSGLIIAAKTSSCRINLGKMFETGEVRKTYCAIVEGNITNCPLTIDEAVDNKPAISHIISSRTLSTADPTSLIEINIETGRTHQIRKHLKSICHPIVGDSLYNTGGLTFGRGLFLTAKTLDFIHPITGDTMHVSKKLPKKFLKYI